MKFNLNYYQVDQLVGLKITIFTKELIYIIVTEDKTSNVRKFVKIEITSNTT